MRLPDPRRSRAYIIGASAFPDAPSLQALPAVENNLAELHRVLTDPVLGGLDPAVCQIAHNPKVRMVEEALVTLQDTDLDTLLIYYAGHGIIQADTGVLHLAMPETALHIIHHTSVSIDNVRRALRRARAKRRILILDCCFSGRALEALSESESVVGGQIDIEGVYTLASSPRNKPSQAKPGARFTAFTDHFLTVLSSGMPEGPELLSLETVYRLVERRMRADGLPPPQQWVTNTAHQLALVRNRLWHTSEKKSPPSTTESSPKVAPAKGDTRRPVHQTGPSFDEGAQIIASTLGSWMPPVELANRRGQQITTTDPLKIALALAPRKGRSTRGARMLRDVVDEVRNGGGDGAATATVIAAAMIRASNEALAGSVREPVLLYNAVKRHVDAVTASLVASARRVSGMDDLLAVVRASTNDSTFAALIEEILADDLHRQITVLEGRAARYDVTDRTDLTVEASCSGLAQRLSLRDTCVVLIDNQSNWSSIDASRKQSHIEAALLVSKDVLGSQALLIISHDFFSYRTAVDYIKGLRPAGLDAPAAQVSITSTFDYQRIAEVTKATSSASNSTDRRLLIGSAASVDITPEDHGLGVSIDGIQRVRLCIDVGRVIDTFIQVRPSRDEKVELFAERLGTLSRAARNLRLANQDGVVAGGGAGLFMAGINLAALSARPTDAAAATVLKAGTEAPLRTLARNAGLDPQASVERALQLSTQQSDQSARHEIVPPELAGTLDPLSVVRRAWLAASSALQRHLDNLVN